MRDAHGSYWNKCQTLKGSDTITDVRPFQGLTIHRNATVGVARSRSPTAINFCPFGTLIRVRYAAVSKPESFQTNLAPPLGDMSKDEFRRFGHELIDWIADYFDKIEELPVLASIEPGDLKAQLPSSPPQQGEPMEKIIADIDRLVVPALTHWCHPSFFAYFATSTSAPGILGELLTAAFDNKAMLWRTSPASTELEEVALDWLRQMMGLDPGMG